MVLYQSTKQMKRMPLRHKRIDQLLYWTYQKQLADVVIDRGVGLHAIERLASGIDIFERDCTERVFQSASLGIRSNMSGASSGDLHPDAEAIHETLKKLPILDQALILSFAKTGLMPGMPDAMEQPRYEACRRKNGRLKYIYARGAYSSRPVLCLVNDLVEPVLFARKTYVEWWEAIERLRFLLSDGPFKLDGIVIEPLVMPKEPWLQNSPSHEGNKK